MQKHSVLRAARNKTRSGTEIVCAFYVNFTQKCHLVQLALAKNARRGQNSANALEAHAHEYMVFARASELKENTAFRERRRREREKFWET